jgi:hypothetical protein
MEWIRMISLIVFVILFQIERIFKYELNKNKVNNLNIRRLTTFEV